MFTSSRHKAGLQDCKTCLVRALSILGEFGEEESLINETEGARGQILEGHPIAWLFLLICKRQ